MYQLENSSMNPASRPWASTLDGVLLGLHPVSLPASLLRANSMPSDGRAGQCRPPCRIARLTGKKKHG
jgi:hypothetical protein